MNLRKYIHPECVLTGLRVKNVGELLRTQAESILRQMPERYAEGLTHDGLLQMLQDREAKQSTGLGNGILVPHARVPGFNHLGLSIAVLAEPLPYDTMDGKPLRLSCMVVAPAETPNIVIKIWSTLARLLNDPAVHAYFLQAPDAATICDYIEDHDLNLDMSVTASDVMVKPACIVDPDTPLPDVTFQMFRTKESNVAVLDASGRMVGQITSDAVFQYGMPEFFTQLQSVSFIRHYNPLEKYFLNESNMLAKDIMSSDYASVPANATLIEVIFLLTVKRRIKVYVISPDGKLLGVIDRLSMLDRAINF